VLTAPIAVQKRSKLERGDEGDEEGKEGGSEEEGRKEEEVAARRPR
jgi:hypothetical protein